MDLSSLNWMYVLAGGLALVALAAIVYFVVFKTSSQKSADETQQPSDAEPEAESFQQESEENRPPESVEQHESAVPSEN